MRRAGILIIREAFCGPGPNVAVCGQVILSGRRQPHCSKVQTFMICVVGPVTCPSPIRPRRRSLPFFRAAPRNAAIGTEPTGSKFFEAVTNPVKRLDHIERIVDSPQLPAQSFDVAVDGAIIDVALLIIRRVH
jgi:hypothetical protein